MLQMKFCDIVQSVDRESVHITPSSCNRHPIRPMHRMIFERAAFLDTRHLHSIIGHIDSCSVFLASVIFWLLKLNQNLIHNWERFQNKIRSNLIMVIQ